MTPDQINGCFEVVAGLLLSLNIIRLHRDKLVRGVHIVPIAFMAIWGFWNLYFYPYIGAPWSFVGGIVVVVVNTIWVGQMIYWKRKEPSRERDKERREIKEEFQRMEKALWGEPSNEIYYAKHWLKK